MEKNKINKIKKLVMKNISGFKVQNMMKIWIVRLKKIGFYSINEHEDAYCVCKSKEKAINLITDLIFYSEDIKKNER